MIFGFKGNKKFRALIETYSLQDFVDCSIDEAFGRIGNFDNVLYRRRNRKVISRYTVSRVVNETGHMLEGDTSRVPQFKLEELKKKTLVIHECWLRQYVSGPGLNPAYYHVSVYLNWHDARVDHRRPRKMISNQYVNALVRSFGGKVV